VPWLAPAFFVGMVGDLSIDPVGDFSDKPFCVSLLDVELTQQFAQLIEA
jgi:hypothetical protein